MVTQRLSFCEKTWAAHCTRSIRHTHTRARAHFVCVCACACVYCIRVAALFKEVQLNVMPNIISAPSFINLRFCAKAAEVSIDRDRPRLWGCIAAPRRCAEQQQPLLAAEEPSAAAGEPLIGRNQHQSASNTRRGAKG